MTSLTDFFSRKWENDINEAFAESYREVNMLLVEDYLKELIAIPFQDFLDFVRSDIYSPFVLSSDVPQFSNIDSATKKICEVLSSRDIKGYKFEEIGELLQPGKTQDIVANKKYGENHVKTASDLGLCFLFKGRYYISPIGVLFPKLSQYQQDQLLARFALRNSFVFTVIRKAMSGLDVSIADEISFLSESTVKRRKNNCLIMCKLIQKNRDVDVEPIVSKIE